MRSATLLLLAAAVAGPLACKGSGSSSGSSTAPVEGTEIDAGLSFLKAAARLNHKEQQDDAWAELSVYGAPKVPITAGSETGFIDTAGRKTDAKVLRFSKLTAWKENGAVKGVLLGEVTLKFERGEVHGPGRLYLQPKDGQWIASALEVDAAAPTGAPGAAPANPPPAAVK
jgi:hypothetical protein